MRMNLRSLLYGTGMAAIALAASAASAQELPGTLAWTAYDVGSTGYGQAVAIGSALKNDRGVTLRVLPGKNDVSRLVPLRADRVQFSAFGIGGYQASEGVYVFGTPDWGPQKIRMLAMSNGDFCNSLIIGGDAGIETMKDLEGKRVAFVKGAPALNHNVYAFLRFGGFEWEDVERVEFGGYGSSMDGVVEDQVDAVDTNSTSGFAEKIMAGPRGGMYPTVPHDDEEGWGRLQEAAPYFFKSMCSQGAGIEEPFEAANYPYPILITYDTQDADMTYAMTKAVFELYPEYKDSAPGANGWDPERQVLDWVVPYHEGAIRYFEEVGMWSDELQAHNDELIARQELLGKAWENYRADAPSDEEEFVAGWQEARAETLEEAGLNPVWTTW